MKNILLAICIVMFTVSCKEETKSETQIKLVSVEEVPEIIKMEDVQLIDVRTAEEYDEGHISDSQNIDFFSDNFEAEMNKLDKNKPLMLYCKSGTRSGKSVKKIEEAGFVKIYDIDGGITDWKSKGYDIQMIP